MKFTTLMNLAHPWRKDLVVFLKCPTHGCCHSARRAFPGVAESNYFLIRVSLLPQGEDVCQGGWGVWECRFLKPSPTICDGPPSFDGRGVSFLVLDSATSPSGFAQNDIDGFYNYRLISSVREVYFLKEIYIWRRGITKTEKALSLKNKYLITEIHF